MLQLPGLLLSLAVASALGLAFYLLLGRRHRDLLFFWLAAVIGFASGHVVGVMWGFIPWTVGQVHILEGFVVALFFLFLARWLGQERGNT
jgi:hypothetical protein